MNIELRQLRCLVAIAEAGSFTDAAIDLGISQAAASRTLASLESALGVRLLRRTTREVTLTAAGSRVLAHARRALAAADDVVREAAAGPARLRIGYAWSAMGRHTTPFQRRWAAEHPDIELQLIRTNSATAGLAEGACDIAVIRTEPDQHRFRDAIVGLERRYCAMAADDPWAARRSLRLAEIGERVLVIDRRTGTTTPDLWPPGCAPGHRVHRRHRRLAHRDRHRALRGRHPGIHRDAVPPAGNRLPAAARRPARPGPAGVVAGRGAPGHRGGCRAAHQPVPLSVAVTGQLACRYRSRIAARSAAAGAPAADRIWGTRPCLIVVSASAMCSTPICGSCLATASRRVSSRIFLAAGVNGMCPLGRGPGAQYRPVASGGRGPGAGAEIMARRARRRRRHRRTSPGGRGPGRLRGSRCAAWALALKPFGGTQELFYNLEFQFPLISEAGIKGVVFYDIGDADNELVLSEMRQDVGFGFRWFSPIGPLRFEWGFPLQRKEQFHEGPVNFEFAIGSPF